MTRTVNWERQGRVAVIQLVNPPTNCINHKLMHDLNQTLDEIDQTDNLGVIVIVSTNDKVFASGKIDSNEGKPVEEVKLFSQILKRILSHRYPTICIINGTVIGSGFELALACDLRISSESSKFGFFSDVRLTDIGKKCLVEIIGPSKAKELMWFGQLIGAKEALGIGVINRMISDTHVLNEGLEMANSIIIEKK